VEKQTQQAEVGKRRC